MAKASDLVIAVDVSGDGPRVIAVVGIREHVLKSRSFMKAVVWVKHFREIGSDRKMLYLATLLRRFGKVKRFLELARICFGASCVQRYIDLYNPLIVLVDDSIYDQIIHPRKIRESRIREAHRRKLMCLADNLANYFRIILKRDPDRFRKELEKFKK